MLEAEKVKCCETDTKGTVIAKGCLGVEIANRMVD